MKKINLLLLLSLVVTIIFSGCNNSATIKIDEYTWTMSAVQNKDGQVIAYGNDESSTLDTATLTELELKAENELITLTDKTNNKSYTGSYKIVDTDSNSTIYDVKIEDTTGKSVCSLTTYKDEENKPTLIITLGDFTLNFFANETK